MLGRQEAKLPRKLSLLRPSKCYALLFQVHIGNLFPSTELSSSIALTAPASFERRGCSAVFFCHTCLSARVSSKFHGLLHSATANLCVGMYPSYCLHDCSYLIDYKVKTASDFICAAPLVHVACQDLFSSKSAERFYSGTVDPIRSSNCAGSTYI